MCLHQMLDPKTPKICGYNKYHVFLMPLVLYVIVVSLINLVGFYYISDLAALAFYAGSSSNFLFSCYKIVNVMVHSNDIWECMDITRCDFMKSYRRYDKGPSERRWRTQSIRMSYVYVITDLYGLFLWSLIPYFFKNDVIAVKETDGTVGNYKINYFNMYLCVSAETYNNHFGVFVCIELFVLICFLYFTILFDSLIVTMSFAISCQLESITNAISLLDNQRSDDGSIGTCIIVNNINYHPLVVMLSI